MPRIAHLSDLHFGSDDRLQPRINDGLVLTLAALQKAGPRIDALVLTGDVFDSSDADPSTMLAFLALFERLDAALGQPQTLILPGNHDRRESGVFGPWTPGLFDELARRLAAKKHVRVLGTRTPFFAQVVDLPGVPADVVAYDSTYLPRGWVSAGGMVRHADFIQLADVLRTREGDRPLLLLLHHHLVPTPVTDTAAIETRGRPWLQKLTVRQVLPRIVGQGDREELTMTALGAGTALSSMHLLGRAVVVLHGHKHYATARLLKAVERGESDVLLTSAGSCGTTQALSTSDSDEAPRLWPSFNLVDLTEEDVRVSAVAWSPWELGRRNAARGLLHAVRDGRRWELRFDSLHAPAFQPVLETNEADYALLPSPHFLGRYDLEVRRTLRATPEATQPHGWDVVEGAPGAKVVDIRCNGEDAPPLRCPAKVKVPATGTASYRVLGAAAASVGEAEVCYEPGTAFEWVGLLNRTRSARARLTVDLGPVTTTPFGSVTDLTTGKERPVRLAVDGRRATVAMESCPARTLLRVSWPLRTD